MAIGSTRPDCGAGFEPCVGLRRAGQDCKYEQLKKDEGGIAKRIFATAVVMVIGFCGVDSVARAEQPSCRVCAEQRAACMKSYAGPAKTECQMCTKSCKKDEGSDGLRVMCLIAALT